MKKYPFPIRSEVVRSKHILQVRVTVIDCEPEPRMKLWSVFQYHDIINEVQTQETLGPGQCQNLAVTSNLFSPPNWKFKAPHRGNISIIHLNLPQCCQWKQKPISFFGNTGNTRFQKRKKCKTHIIRRVYFPKALVWNKIINVQCAPFLVFSLVFKLESPSDLGKLPSSFVPVLAWVPLIYICRYGLAGIPW